MKSVTSPPPEHPSSPPAPVPKRRVIRVLIWVRRSVQALALLCFLWLLTATTFRGHFAADAAHPIRLAHPVEFFLFLDPYAALLTALSAQALPVGLLWSLVTIALTVVFGRVFCGWVCPLGTLNHLLGHFAFPRRRDQSRRVAINRGGRAQVIKTYLLLAGLGSALFGSVLFGMLDPICIAVRSLGLGVFPVAHYASQRGTGALSELGGRGMGRAMDGVDQWLASELFTPNLAYTHHGWVLVALFFGILLTNLLVPRFFCRYLCPLGALLGQLSRFALLGMEKSHEKCTDCDKCVLHCQGADSPEGGKKHRQAECHVCLNCEASCPEGVLRWKFLPNRRSIEPKVSLEGRRAVLCSLAGAAAVPALRIGNWPDRAYDERMIRPPGSLPEREFLERCIHCGACMKVCPNNALHPALFEAGLEGLWTPILIPRIGYCEHSCVLCSQVCPTGAIRPITEREKLGLGQPPIRLGTAMYDFGRCLPWAMATPCIVCEEFCPTSPKAIWVEEVTVPRRASAPPPGGGEPSMGQITVKRPHIDPTLCIGCGACEKACPVVDKPAVYVTSAGESRSATNVILLGKGRRLRS